MSVADEEEWEEQLVFVELEGLVNPDHLDSCTAENCSILKLTSDNPVLRLGGHVFAGEYDDCIGTAVFFEDQGDGKPLKYFSKTTKTLKMSRAFLQRIDNTTSENTEEDDLDTVEGNDDSNETSDICFNVEKVP